MKIIISPAKQMRTTDEFYFDLTTPEHLDKSRVLLNDLQSKTYPELKTILNCSDALATKAYHIYQSFDYQKDCTPALFAYKGIQYQYMGPEVLEDSGQAYLIDHLFILSAFYGLLRPSDGIVPYRLEMQAKMPYSLYDFWKDDLANAIRDDVILNLASEEYAKVIRPYKPLIDVRFYERINNRLIEKGVYVKMARGNMVRFLAQHNIQDIEGVRQFQIGGYEYQPDLSDDHQIVFVRNDISQP